MAGYARFIILPTSFIGVGAALLYIMAITKVFNTPPPPPPPKDPNDDSSWSSGQGNDPHRNNNNGNNSNRSNNDGSDKRPTPPSKAKSGGFLANKPNLRLVLLTAAVLSLLGMVAFGGLFFAVLGGYFGDLPSRTELFHIQNPLASEVMGNDGKTVLGKFYFQNRSYVPYAQISPNVIGALVATEDERFFRHKGVDVISMGRVLLKSILLGDDAGGGSTISQQVIKNLFPRQSHGMLSMPVNKMREAIIAYRLENTYTKEQVLGLYLNTVPFGENMYGIGSAAQRFYSKKASELKPDEAAVLVGMLKANTTYNPRLNPDKAKARRNTVLEQMRKNGYLNATQTEQFKKLPITLNYRRDSADDGLAPHLRERLRQEVQAYLKAHPKTDGTTYNVYTDGLKIETTIDPRMQQYAEEAVTQHLSALQKKFDEHWKGKKPWGTATDILVSAKKQSDRYLNMKKNGASEVDIDKAFRTKVPMKLFTWQGEVDKTITPLDSIQHYLMFLNTGFVAADPYTGEVRAYVGSINHQYFKYNYANTRRQVGSTFKPIVYAAAIEQGIEPCKFYPNELQTYNNYQNWTPKNSEDEYGGYYTMKGALAKSINTISVQILFDAGIENVVLLANRLGIESNIPNMPSIALGTAEISLQEMTSAYAAFDNGGYYTPLVYLKSIKDRNGKTIAEFKPKDYRQRGQVMQANTARLITDVMTAVVDSGTARRLRTEYKLNNAIAGKTGTTQAQADGWFVGYTPTLVAGAWVGGFDQRIRFRSIAQGQGAAMALPIWGIFMSKLNKDGSYWKDTYKQFAPLSADQQTQLDCPNYSDYPTSHPANDTATDWQTDDPANPNEVVSDNNNAQQQPPVFHEGSPNNKAPNTTPPNRVKVRPNEGNQPNNTPPPAQRKGNFWEKVRDAFEKK